MYGYIVPCMVYTFRALLSNRRIIAAFPGPAQLSIACRMEKQFSFTRGESLETRLGGISFKEPIRQEVVNG